MYFAWCNGVLVYSSPYLGTVAIRDCILFAVFKCMQIMPRGLALMPPSPSLRASHNAASSGCKPGHHQYPRQIQ